MFNPVPPRRHLPGVSPPNSPPAPDSMVRDLSLDSPGTSTASGFLSSLCCCVAAVAERQQAAPPSPPLPGQLLLHQGLAGGVAFQGIVMACYEDGTCDVDYATDSGEISSESNVPLHMVLEQIDAYNAAVVPCAALGLRLPESSPPPP